MKTAALLILAGVCLCRVDTVLALSPAGRWLPTETILALEVQDTKPLIDLLAGPDMLRTLESLPAYQALKRQKGTLEMQALVRFVELALEMEWREVLGRLTRGGIHLAVCPQDRLVLMIDAEEEALLKRLHDLMLDMVHADGGSVASRSYHGVTTWSFDGNEHHALIGRRLVFANQRAALHMVLDQRRQPRKPSLADKASYQAAQRAVSTERFASAFVDAETLLQVPDIAAHFQSQRDNPLAALFFAGLAEAVRGSTWLALEAGIEGHALTVQARVDGRVQTDTGPAAFALPAGPGQGAQTNLAVPHGIAGLSLYRDLHRFYAAKDDLFPERTSGLIFFENMMGIFFSGRDLTDEVLARARPSLRLVVAEQTYDPAIGTPQVKIPGFAAVLRLNDPDAYDEMVEEAWQKALGLINFTRGQQALPGLIIDRPVHRGTQFSIAYFSARDETSRERLHMRYNFRPALALPGDYVILSSTESLARDLIDAVQTAPGGPAAVLPQTHSLLEIDGAPLASILEANQTVMVQNNMVEKGHSRAEAEKEIGMLCTLAGLVDHIRLGFGLDQGVTQASLRLGLRLP
jgi:hypothetical protein